MHRGLASVVSAGDHRVQLFDLEESPPSPESEAMSDDEEDGSDAGPDSMFARQPSSDDPGAKLAWMSAR